jgi:hypothetical protein
MRPKPSPSWNPQSVSWELTADSRDPFDALTVFDGAGVVDVLVTRTVFPAGKPNGISLALMARQRRPTIKIVFTSREENERLIDGIGELVPHPVSLPALVEAVARALADPGKER